MSSSFFLGSVAAAIGFFTLFTKFRFQQDNKDTKSSSLSPPSSSLSRIWKHHVFPSFHGPDVRTTFFSHVWKEFRGKGIDLFIDNNIERSKTIGPELVEAIRGSKIAIILLSKISKKDTNFIDFHLSFVTREKAQFLHSPSPLREHHLHLHLFPLVQEVDQCTTVNLLNTISAQLLRIIQRARANRRDNGVDVNE